MNLVLIAIRNEFAANIAIFATLNGDSTPILKPFLTIKKQLVMVALEKTFLTQSLNLVTVHPLHRFHFVFLKMKQFHRHIALKHIKHRKLILESSNSQ